MSDREIVIKALENAEMLNGVIKMSDQFRDIVVSILKEQEGYVSVPFSWLVKFCSHIDFKEPLTDEEREKEWKSKLKQQFDIDV